MSTTAEHGKPEILVVGSSNMDLISYVDEFPKPGETIRGHKFSTVCLWRFRSFQRWALLEIR